MSIPLSDRDQARPQDIMRTGDAVREALKAAIAERSLDVSQEQDR